MLTIYITDVLKTKTRANMIYCLFVLADVPDPPGRPIATNFTSRSVTISWAPSENSHNNPISHYIINVR